MATKTKAAKPNRREHFKTSSGIELPVDFNPSNTEPLDYDRDLGEPGEFHTLEASEGTCTGAGFGPCASMPVMPAP